jgi:hypothetical protein
MAVYLTCLAARFGSRRPPSFFASASYSRWEMGRSTCSWSARRIRAGGFCAAHGVRRDNHIRSQVALLKIPGGSGADTRRPGRSRRRAFEYEGVPLLYSA